MTRHELELLHAAALDLSAAFNQMHFLAALHHGDATHPNDAERLRAILSDLQAAEAKMSVLIGRSN